MYNNEITYDERWNTSENLKYQEMIAKKYFPRSHCSPSCPASWAKEVWELLEYLDSEFGIAYNTHTFSGYYIQGNPFYQIFVEPFISLVKDSYKVFIGCYLSKKDGSWEDSLNERFREMSLPKKIERIAEGFTHPINYGFRSLKHQYIYPIFNKIKKPKIHLSQIKEKYGTLRVYFSAPDYLDDHIESKIRDTEMLLAKKGAYYPPESFFFAGSSWNCATDYHPNEYEVKYETGSDGKQNTHVTFYNYRQALKNAGFDLDQMRLMAEERRAIKNEET